MTAPTGIRSKTQTVDNRCYNYITATLYNCNCISFPIIEIEKEIYRYDKRY